MMGIHDLVTDCERHDPLLGRGSDGLATDQCTGRRTKSGSEVALEDRDLGLQLGGGRFAPGTEVLGDGVAAIGDLGAEYLRELFVGQLESGVLH
jgi:hypothetical protein